MRIISKRKLREFWAIHARAKAPMEEWFQLVKKTEWETLEDVRSTFGKRVDPYGKFVVFDIGGNKYRLIAAIHYNTGILYIRHVLTHAEYSTGDWKKE